MLFRMDAHRDRHLIKWILLVTVIDIIKFRMATVRTAVIWSQLCLFPILNFNSIILRFLLLWTEAEFSPIASYVISILSLSYSQFQFHHSYYELGLSFQQAANLMAVQFQALCLFENSGFENLKIGCVWGGFSFILISAISAGLHRGSHYPAGWNIQYLGSLALPYHHPLPYSIWGKKGIRTVSRGEVFFRDLPPECGKNPNKMSFNLLSCLVVLFSTHIFVVNWFCTL